MASPGSQHCANCIGTLSFSIRPHRCRHLPNKAGYIDRTPDIPYVLYTGPEDAVPQTASSPEVDLRCGQMHDSFCPAESTPHTAALSVRLFQHRSSLWPTHTRTKTTLLL